MNAYIADTKALEENLAILRGKAGSAVVYAVVKGNGYGLGAGALARFYAGRGIDHFAVTDLAEARAVRQETAGEILMLRGTCNGEELRELLSLDVTCSVGSPEDLAALEALGQELGCRPRVHVKVDTGMGRYGFLPEETPAMARVFDRLTVTGIYTHFHTAGNRKVTMAQYGAFRGAVDALRAMGLEPGLVHCCNSLAFWYYPELHLDAVRLGSALLGRVGYGPRAGLRRVGYVRAEVEELRCLPKGHNVGYGGDCRLRRETRIAVVGVGYLHGFSVERGYDVFRPRDCLRSMGRYLKYLLKGKKLWVEVNGRPCPVLGHVGMVNLVADVTDVPCQVHDPVTVQINPLDLKGMDVVFREDGDKGP